MDSELGEWRVAVDRDMVVGMEILIFLKVPLLSDIEIDV